MPALSNTQASPAAPLLSSSTSPSRLAKSNRAQGDLFELLVIKNLVADLNGPSTDSLSFDYEAHLTDITIQLSSTPDGLSRIAVQNSRANSVRPALFALANNQAAKLGPVSSVLWTGRAKDPSTTADVRLTHASSTSFTDLTLKSTSQGTGTLRNLGLTGRLIKKYVPSSLSADFSALAPTMFSYAKEAVAAVSGTARLSEVASPRRFRRSLLNDLERAAAASVGRDAADLASEFFIELFNQLDSNQRRLIVNELLGCPGPNVFSVVANDQSTYVGPLLAPTGPLTIARNSNPAVRGLWIKAKDIPVIRLEFNCTNGLGISPLCLRSFRP